MIAPKISDFLSIALQEFYSYSELYYSSTQGPPLTGIVCCQENLQFRTKSTLYMVLSNLDSIGAEPFDN